MFIYLIRSDKICYYECILELLIFIIYYYGTIVVYYIIVCRLTAWSGPSYEIKIYYILFQRAGSKLTSVNSAGHGPWLVGTVSPVYVLLIIKFFCTICCHGLNFHRFASIGFC